MRLTMTSRLTAEAALAKRKVAHVLNEQGSNEYVKENPGFLKFFLKGIDQVRRQNNWTSAQFIYAFIGCTFIYSTPSIVAQYVPKKDFDILSRHLEKVLTKLVEKGGGNVMHHDCVLLNASSNACIIPGFFESMARNNVFEPLAKFCSLFMNQNETVAIDLLQFVRFSVTADMPTSESTSYSDGAYRILSHLEARGVLAQAFHAMVLPNQHERTCLIIIDRIEREPRIVGKKLRVGTETGNVLKKICQASIPSMGCSASERSSANDDTVMNALKRLHRAAESGKGMVVNKKSGICMHCMKVVEKLKFCSRCHTAAYCSKDCQESAWRDGHKKSCTPKYANMMKRNNSIKTSTIYAFQSDNYLEIMEEASRVTREHKLTIQDVVLELDFMPPSDLSSPAPAAKGKFKIDTIERYTSGSRPAKPCWKHLPLDKMLTDLRKLYETKPGRMLGFVRNADRSGSLFQVGTPNDPRWSNDALACFPLDTDENIERLTVIGKWKNREELEYLRMRTISRQVDEMCGQDRETMNDYIKKLEEELKQKKNAENS